MEFLIKDQKELKDDEIYRRAFKMVLNEIAEFEPIIKQIVFKKYAEIEGYGTMLYGIDVLKQDQIYKHVNNIDKPKDLSSDFEIENDDYIDADFDVLNSLDTESHDKSNEFDISSSMIELGVIHNKDSDESRSEKTVDIDLKDTNDEPNFKSETKISENNEKTEQNDLDSIISNQL